MFLNFPILIILTMVSLVSNIIVDDFFKRVNFLEKKTLEISVIILIFISYLNANIIIPGKFLSVIYLVLFSCYLIYNIKKIDIKEVVEHFTPLFIVYIFINFIFDISSSWVVEGYNHDLIYYYQIALSAFEHSITQTPFDMNYPTISVSEFQGYNASLVRQGGSELFSLYTIFSNIKEPNIIYFQYLIVVLLLSRLSNVVYSGDNLLIRILIISLLSFSPGYLNALVNSNIPTFLGSSLLVVTLGICAIKDKISLKNRYLSVTLCLSLATLFYGEMFFYCGFIIFIYFCIDLFSVKLRDLLKLVGICGVIFVFLANITIFTMLKSILLLNHAVDAGGNNLESMPTIVQWGAYLFYNPLGGYYIPKERFLTLLSYLSLSIIAVLNFNFNNLAVKISIVSISILLILIVNITGYQYGIHKTYQILSPLWFFLLIYSIFKLKSNVVYVLTIIPLVITSLHIREYKKYIDSVRSIHVIKDDLFDLATLPSRGSNVAIDQYDMKNFSGFQKSHYLALSLYNNGSYPYIGDFDDFQLKGGYYRKELSKSYDLNKLDYMISMQPEYSRRYIKKASSKYIFKENEDFVIYKISERFSYLYILNGIYNYETNYVFSDGNLHLKPIVLEGTANLHITLTPFYLSNLSSVDVYFDEVLVKTYSVRPNEKVNIDLKVVDDVENVYIRAKWHSRTPKELGINGDNRKLSFQLDNLIFE